MATNLYSLGASELAEAIRTKQVTSREVVEAHLARIAEVNPKLNAVTLTLADSALAEADAADAAVAAGGEIGPLHGIPFSVKENIDLAGSATTQGLQALAQAIPGVDAPHIAQLRKAGGIPFARTNLPDFALRWHTDNELHGATKNPWDATRTPGGSSGGEAAALATGMTPLGVGNDLGGSLRWPSQCNGTAAIRPTAGRVPDASFFPPQDFLAGFAMMAVQGPMARRVADLRLALRSMSGFDARDPHYVPAPLTGRAVPKRAALCLDFGVAIDPDVAAGVRRAADALKDAGYEIEETAPPAIVEARELWADVLLSEVNTAMLPLLGPIAGKDAVKFLNLGLEAHPPKDYAGYMTAFGARNAIARQWGEFQQRYPVILGPVSTAQPFKVGRDLESKEAVLEIMEQLTLVVAINLLGLPSAVVPTGVANGLPQSVQVIAGRYREDVSLDAAEAIEQRLGTITPIDPR